MTPAKFLNDLKYYTLEVSVNAEMAETVEKDFITKFDALDKYSQMELAFFIEAEGWEAGFKELYKMY
jgi:hypothetical protein